MNVILADVFFFYKQNFSRLIAYIVPVSLIITLISVGIAHTFSEGDPQQHLKLLVVSNFLLNPLYLGGFTFLLSNITHKRSVSLSQCLMYGFYTWIPVLAVSIVYGMVTTLGLFLFIFPGIWIFSRLILSPFSVILERKSPIDALTESFKDTADESWRIMGTTTILFLGTVIFR